MTRVEGRRHLRDMLVEHFGDDWREAYRAFWLAWRVMGMPDFDECESNRALSAMAFVVAGLVHARDVVRGTEDPMAMISGAN